MDFHQFEEAVTAGTAQKNARLYALVDHAGAPGLMGRLLDRPNTRWLSLFAGTRDEAALQVAPLLLHIETLYQRPWLQWFHDACRESTSLTLLYSTLDLSELAQNLKHRLAVMLPDDVPALLRYFDTRVLESLLQALEPQQRESFFGIAACWQWLDRAGDLQQYSTVQLPDDPWPAKFALSEKQQNLMIEDAEADVLVQQMHRHGQNLCTGCSRAALHALATACITKMDQQGIEGAPARSLFTLAALQYGIDFPEKPEWQYLMDRIRRNQLNPKSVIFQQS